MTLRKFLEVYNMYCDFAIYDAEDNSIVDQNEMGYFQSKRDHSELKDEWLDSEIITVTPWAAGMGVDISLAYKETILLNV